jgi:hypothetical protein
MIVVATGIFQSSFEQSFKLFSVHLFIIFTVLIVYPDEQRDTIECACDLGLIDSMDEFIGGPSGL